MSRKWAIGDIHGCLSKLEDLIGKLDPTPEDTLIFLGDYIDRGADSRGVVDFLLGLSSSVPCIFLRGNHEDMFLNYLEFGTNETLYFANGGVSTLVSYGAAVGRRSQREMVLALPEPHRDFFASLRWHFEDQSYIYVHAGVIPQVPFAQQPRDRLIWIRDEFIFAATGLEKKVIFGHTPFTRPLVKPDKIGIDTGAVYGGSLTALELPQETFVHSSR